MFVISFAREFDLEYRAELCGNQVEGGTGVGAKYVITNFIIPRVIYFLISAAGGAARFFRKICFEIVWITFAISRLFETLLFQMSFDPSPFPHRSRRNARKYLSSYTSNRSLIKQQFVYT